MKANREFVTEQMQKAFEAMQGMTYLEWSKFSFVINQYYETEATQHKKRMVLDGSEGLPEMFERLL